MTVVVGSLLALLAIVALARWEATRKDAHARRLGLLVDGQLVGEVEPEPLDDEEPGKPHDDEPEPAESRFSAASDDRHHGPEPGTRKFVTVAEIKRRISREASLAADREWRRRARRAAATEQTAELPELPEWPPRPYPRRGCW